MDLSVIAFLALLLAVALLRFVELRISRRHQQEMIARGAAKVDETEVPLDGFAGTPPCWRALPSKSSFLRRSFIPQLAAVMFAVFLAANARSAGG